MKRNNLGEHYCFHKWGAYIFSNEKMHKILAFYFSFALIYSPKGEWANPGGTAIPGQPVGKSEQAPVSSPKFKNQFNIVDPQWGSYQILS